MQHAYRATVIVPVIGRADRTLSFVEHLTAVTPPESFELVLVDIGSHDATSDVLRALSGDVQVARLAQPARPATAANLGAKMANGKHLVFFRAECRPAPGWLERLIATLETYEQVGAVGPAISVPDSTVPGGSNLLAGLTVIRREDGLLDVAACRQMKVSTPQRQVTALPSLAAIYRREAFEEVSGFDEAYQDGLADLDLGLRLKQASWASLADFTVTVTWMGPSGTSARPADEELAIFTERWSKHVHVDAGATSPTGPASPAAPVGSIERRWGANVVGYFEAELGLGQSARLVVDAIEAAGGACTTHSWYRHYSRAAHKYRHRGQELGSYPYPVDVVCLNGDMLPYFAAEHADVFGRRYTIGFWHWELEALPPHYVRALDLVDEVWVGSEFTRRAVAASTDKPVTTVPLPVPMRQKRPVHNRAEAHIPKGFVFGFMFDARSTVDRKNPAGLIAAFTHAFEPGEGPFLLVKVTNGDWAGVARKLSASATGRPDIMVFDGYLPPDLAEEWTGLVDCYVSLHRSEGFGLTIAEAMSWGTPVIVTAYSGNMDFTTADNAFLVDWSRAQVLPGNPCYPAGGHWAEPHLASASALMRWAWEHPEAARARGQRGQEDLQRSHSLKAAAEVVSARMHEIEHTVRGTRHARHQGHRPQWLPAPLPSGGQKPAALRLNLGAGDNRKDGYLSVDLRSDAADVLADVARLPFADESAAEIFASDLLEHFPATKTAQVLAEWHRVLAPGGKLTLRVPNLLALAKLLLEHPHTRVDVIRNIYGGHRWGPDGAWDTHHTGWTPELLHQELDRAGYLVMSDDGDLNNTVTAMRLGG